MAPKETSPGWPEPNDWVKRLESAMQKRQHQFNLATTDAERRRAAAGCLGITISALQQLPPFQDVQLLLALKHLRVFLEDLEIGKDHPWLKDTGKGGAGGGNTTPTAEQERRYWIRAVLPILTSNGFGKMEAYERIASGLRKSGRTMPKGRKITDKRVAEWCRETPPNWAEEDFVHRLIGKWWLRYLEDMRADENEILRNGPGLKSAAGRFVDALWTTHILIDIPISTQSKRE